MRVKLLFNPSAGKGKGKRKIEVVRSFLQRLGTVVDFEAPASRKAFADAAQKASSEGYDRIIVAGGDGSLHVVVNSIDLETNVLAIIPMGSGDDFAKTLQIPTSAEEACRVAIEGTVREVDVAMANDRRFLGVAGVGFDSVVASYANRVERLSGSFLYLYSIFRVLPRFRPLPLAITSAGVRREEEVMFVVVGNSPRYGGGIRIAPSAELNDGILDLFVIGKSTKWDLLKTLPSAYTGRHVSSPFVTTERGTSFHFDSPDALEVYADGELVATTPVTIALSHQKMQIAVPR